MKDLIHYTASLLCKNTPADVIQERLLSQGLTEYQVFLTIKAAEIIAADRVNSRKLREEPETLPQIQIV